LGPQARSQWSRRAKTRNPRGKWAAVRVLRPARMGLAGRKPGIQGGNGRLFGSSSTLSMVSPDHKTLKTDRVAKMCPVATQNRQRIGFRALMKGDHGTFVASQPPGGTEAKNVRRGPHLGGFSCPVATSSGQIQPSTPQLTPVGAGFSPFRPPYPPGAGRSTHPPRRCRFCLSLGPP
jgi:hypothetical protein